MTDKTKLLRDITGVIEFHRERDLGREELAQAVIDTTADWFEDVLENIGMAPRVIPTLLRWQAHQHEHLSDSDFDG
jgi:hypothetical protein